MTIKQQADIARAMRRVIEQVKEIAREEGVEVTTVHDSHHVVGPVESVNRYRERLRALLGELADDVNGVSDGQV